MTLLSIVGVIVLVAGYLHPTVYLYDLIGMAGGGIIAFYAIRSTSFEWRKDAWFYRPNPWIGVLLTVLFVGRIAYRLYQDSALLGGGQVSESTANNAQLSAYAHDPITGVILFALVMYYVVYYTFLIRRERHLEKSEEHEVV